MSISEQSNYEILNVTQADRFCAVFENGQKIRLACWVLLKDKITNEYILTGAYSRLGDGAKLTLGVNDNELTRYTPI